MNAASWARGVLVLDGTPRTVVAISRSLHGRGVRVICAQLGRSGLGRGSNSVTADVALPVDEDGFFERLKQLLSQYDIDTIVPCSDRALSMLVVRYEELTQRVYLTCPEPRILLQVLDKDATLKVARECGIKVPTTYTIKDVDELQKIKHTLRFPVVAKPSNVGVLNPFKIKYFNTLAELESFLEYGASGSHNVFQEFFLGEGVGIATVVADGKPLALFQHKRIHEWPARGGVGVLFESEALDPELASAAETLLKRLEWWGPAMVEFRRNRRTGESVLMEVNGRFWGSLPLAVAAGLDFPYFQWQVIHRAQPQLPKTYKIGLRMRWTTGEIRRLAQLMTSPSTRRELQYSSVTPVIQFMQSLDPRVRSALFSYRDMRPAIDDVAQTIARLAIGNTWTLLKKMLPASWTRRLSQLRHLDPANRRTYLFQWFLRSVRLRGLANKRRLVSARRVTFVCRGNRIRSPLAAAILESKLNGRGDEAFHIRSAGTRATPADGFDPRAKAAAEAMGLDLIGRPQSVAADLVNDSEIIVVMDRIIEAELLTQFPAAGKKVFLFPDIVGEHMPEAGEILDPDKSSQLEFSRCISQLTNSVHLLAHRLLQ